MVYVEQLLKGLCQLVVSNVITDTWRRSFITNVTQHADNGSPLSTSQSKIVCQIAGNYHKPLATVLSTTTSVIAQSIAKPQHKQAPYQSADIKREVRYVGMNKIAFRFKLDQTVVADIKALRTSSSYCQTQPAFNSEYRLWVVMVDNENLEKVFNLIKRHKFDFDEPVLEFLTRCSNSRKVHSAFVLDPETNDVYINVCNNPLLAHVVKNIMKAEPL
jgi:hypothetical protein